MFHGHWEVDSICPRCGRVNHVQVPVGERVIRVFCQHCTHGYEYTHVVMEHTVVEDKADEAGERAERAERAKQGKDIG